MNITIKLTQQELDLLKRIKFIPPTTLGNTNEFRINTVLDAKLIEEDDYKDGKLVRTSLVKKGLVD